MDCGYVEADADGGIGCHEHAVAVTAFWQDRRRDAIGEEFLCERHGREALGDGADVEDLATGRLVHTCAGCGGPVWGRAAGDCDECVEVAAI